MTRCLFVPVSGGSGTGEVQRCRLLAGAVHTVDPDIAPHFLLAPGASAEPWPSTPLPSSPTRAVAAVAEAIRSLRPAVVVFDGNTRVAAMDAARAVGARIVLLSSRPSARDRGFRLRRMSRLDEHWIVGADAVAARRWRERLGTVVYPRVTVRRFSTLFASPDDPAPLLARLGITGRYVVACAGGGGYPLDGRTSGELFGEAAALAAGAGLDAVAVAAPAPPPALATGALDNAELMALLSRSEAALLAGGSLLVQALALGVPTVAVPLQREQAGRVTWLASHGATQGLEATDPAAMAAALRGLAEDAGARERLRDAAAALGLRNDLEPAARALAALVHDAPETDTTP